MVVSLSPSTFLWFLVGQLYLDFWVDHPLWSGDYSSIVLDNMYHHYVQTKDHGHWLFREAMQIAMTLQLLFLLFRCWRVGRIADWISLACNAAISVCFLVMIISNRDAMSAIGKVYQYDELKRAQFISHVDSLTNAHAVVLLLCLGGIIADYFTAGSSLIFSETMKLAGSNEHSKRS